MSEQIKEIKQLCIQHNHPSGYAGSAINVGQQVLDIIDKHVEIELEAIDALRELYKFGDAVGKHRLRKEAAYIAAAKVLRKARGES